jgi:hypothetical protein
MRLTPSQVKNLMRRGLRLLLDPDLEKEDRARVIEFFEHRCAYCGCPIQEGKGDLDHLVSASRRGSNHISNRVLSCKPCNAEEKRETDWQDFLWQKSGAKTSTFAQRKRKIEQWARACGDARTLPEKALHVLEEECRRVTAEYDAACRRIRKAKQT